MAEAAISSAVNFLGELVIKEWNFLADVEDQVNWLKDELQRMRCFLKDAAQKQANNERIRNWVSEIRTVAQDAEDAIKTFLLKVDTPRSTRKWCCFPTHANHLRRVRKEIESIRSRLENIESSRQRYGIQNLGEGMDSSTRAEEGVELRRRLFPWHKDKHIVGLGEDVKLLLEKAILDDREGLSIASIVGMGGIGKSTLAKKLYNHAAVAERFNRRAWVVVSSQFEPREIIKELMLQFLEPDEDKLTLSKTVDELPLPTVQQMLHQRLQGGRYFIVVDDVWENQHWEILETFFPVDGSGSRLLITSRDRAIAKDADYVHEMKRLNSKDSWELLMKKAFIDNNEDKCPKDLESVGKEISRKCNGLPSAIIEVGHQLLDRNPSKSKWEKILNEMNSWG